MVVIPSSGAYFSRFFGHAHPVLVVFAASVLGAFALGLLQTCGGFRILRGRATLRGMALSAGFATMFAAAIVIADLFIRYPADMNVPMPQALLFYPVVGFVAEIVFHVLPLALLVLAMTPLAKVLGTERVVWLGILIVSTLEPTFQVLFVGRLPRWSSVYTWVHIYGVSFLQLCVFKRYDFVSMYSFRLFYYAYWHVVWGVIRLKVLI